MDGAPALGVRPVHEAHACLPGRAEPQVRPEGLLVPEPATAVVALEHGSSSQRGRGAPFKRFLRERFPEFSTAFLGKLGKLEKGNRVPFCGREAENWAFIPHVPHECL